MARGGKFALFAFERASVRANVDGKRRWLQLDGRECFGIVTGRDSVADVGFVNTGDGDDVASGGF